MEVLSRSHTASAPEYIIDMLDKFKRKYHLNAGDELWMIIDVDRWGERKLRLISSQCLQKNYFLAVSNPCSDLWFLLHKKSLSDYPAETLLEFFENKKQNKRTRLEIELIKVFGEFNKKNLNSGQFVPLVRDAVERARALDVDTNHRWPVKLGTRIYLLVEKIL